MPRPVPPLPTRVPGVLTIGTDASSPGLFHFGDPGSPEFSGFDVELCRALAARLGLVPRFADCLWSRIFDELSGGTFDMVCTAATVTAARRKVVDFTVPYFDVEVAVVTRRNASLATLDDLRGQRIGVRVATTAEEAIREYLPCGHLHTYDHNVDAYHDLHAGKTDAVVDDFPIAQYFLQHQAEFKIIGLLPGSASQYAMMLAKGNHVLRVAVDRALNELSAEGFHARLYEEWFGEGS